MDDPVDIWSHALFAWFADCQRMHGDDGGVTYADLCNGHSITMLFAYITNNAAPAPSIGTTEGGRRLTCLSRVMGGMLAYYRDELKQLVVMPLPDLLSIAKHPQADASGGEMKKVLLLLLGCAVQSDKKEEFVHRIKELEVELQKIIVEQIQKITSNAECVLNLQALEIAADDGVAATVLHQLQRVVTERDSTYAQLVGSADVIHETPEEEASASGSSVCTGDMSARTPPSDEQAAAAAAIKADLRAAHGQLDEQSAVVAELRDELCARETQLASLQAQVVHLSRDARAVSDYRDELDCMQQKVDELNKVDTHNKKLQERLTDMNFYKGRVEELLQENSMLSETKGVLEEQMVSWRARVTDAGAVDVALAAVTTELTDTRSALAKERDTNAELDYAHARAQKQLTTLTAQYNQLQTEVDTATNTPRAAVGALDGELQSSERQSVLALELSNQKLIAQIDTLNDELLSRRGEGSGEVHVEMERLNVQIVQATERASAADERNVRLVDELTTYKQQAVQLEQSCTQWQFKYETSITELHAHRATTTVTDGELARLQADIARAKAALGHVQQQKADGEASTRAMEESLATMQTERAALSERLAERDARLTLLERDSGRMDDMTRAQQDLQSTNTELTNERRQMRSQFDHEASKCARLTDELIDCKTQLNDMTSRVATVCQRCDVDEVHMFDTHIVAKLMARERSFTNLQTSYNEQNAHLASKEAEVDALNERLRGADAGDAAALVDLQEENRSIKEQIQILQSNIRRANADVTATSADMDGVRTAMERVQRERATTTVSQTEFAKMEVQVASAQAQCDLLGQDNVELQKQCASLQRQSADVTATYKSIQYEHNELLADHDHLQRLHEQLAIDYETLKMTQTTLQAHMVTMDAVTSKTNADERAIDDMRALLHTERTSGEQQLRRVAQIQNEYSQLANVNETLDARNATLQADNTRLMTDCTAMADAEQRALYAHSQLASLQDTLARQELAMCKTRHRSDMIEQLNRTLEEESRTLLRQLDTLIAQNQELFTRALLDKDAYHTEHRDFQDKLHALKRHKEKLEEKIIDQYKGMDASDAYRRESGGAAKDTFMRRAARALLPNKKMSSQRASVPPSEDSYDDLQSTSNAPPFVSRPVDETHSDSAGEMMINGYRGASTSSCSPDDSSSNSRSPNHNERAVDVVSVNGIGAVRPPPVYKRPPPPAYGSQRRLSSASTMSIGLAPSVVDNSAGTFRPSQTSTPTPYRTTDAVIEEVVLSLDDDNLGEQLVIRDEHDDHLVSDDVDNEDSSILPKKETVWYEYGCV